MPIRQNSDAKKHRKKTTSIAGMWLICLTMILAIENDNAERNIERIPGDKKFVVLKGMCLRGVIGRTRRAAAIGLTAFRGTPERPHPPQSASARKTDSDKYYRQDNYQLKVRTHAIYPNPSRRPP